VCDRNLKPNYNNNLFDLLLNENLYIRLISHSIFIGCDLGIYGPCLVDTSYQQEYIDTPGEQVYIDVFQSVETVFLLELLERIHSNLNEKEELKYSHIENFFEKYHNKILDEFKTISDYGLYKEQYRIIINEMINLETQVQEVV